MGPNPQPLRAQGKGKRKNTNGRKNQGNVSLKTEIRGGSNVHDMNRLYSSSNQPQRSHAINSRGVSGSQVSASNISGVSGSITSKQFQQVRLRPDVSLKSNKSPNRYTNSVASNQNHPVRHAPQTIQYASKPHQAFAEDAPGYHGTIGGPNVKQISQSLVAQNRNRNLIGQSLNRPHVKPIDSQSVGINPNFMNKNQNRGQSQVVAGNHQLQSINGSINPITMEDNNDISRSAAKPKTQQEMDPLVRRDSQNSQRSFRIRSYKRSISRGSNISKMSNLTDNHGPGETPLAKKTIEQPTDVEDADANFDNASDFDHFNNSPDIKLKSIEIDDDFTGQ
jgi:hypothetical protein